MSRSQDFKPWRSSVAFNEEQVQAYFSSPTIHLQSPAQQAGIQTQKFDFHCRLVRHAIARAVHLLPPGASKALDVGCSSGYLTAELTKYFSDVTGIDQSQPLLECAENRDMGARFVYADARKIPFQDGTFDLVTCSSLVHYTRDWKMIIDNCVRVVKPGGIVMLQFVQARPVIELLMRAIGHVVLGHTKIRNACRDLSYRISTRPEHGYHWRSIDGRPIVQVVEYISQLGMLFRELHSPRRFPFLNEEFVAVIAQRMDNASAGYSPHLICRTCFNTPGALNRAPRAAQRK